MAPPGRETTRVADVVYREYRLDVLWRLIGFSKDRSRNGFGISLAGAGRRYSQAEKMAVFDRTNKLKGV